MNIDNRLTIYGFDEQDETILNNRISKFGLTSVPAKAIAVYEIGSPNAADVTATLYNNGLLEFDGSGDMTAFYYYDEMPWYDYRSNITSVLFKEGNTIKPTSTAYLFYELSNITSLDLSNLDTSNVTVMTWMFNSCESLIEIKGSENLVSSKVTTMERMFNACTSLTSLETSNWNTSNVSIMTGIFDGCKSLTSLDLSSFNTSKVKSMDSMFYGCESLTEIIGLDNFDTSKVTNMSYMFYECSKLTSSITIMNSSANYYSDMFSVCSTEPGSEFIVYYIDSNTKTIAQNMVNTKSSNSNVILYIEPAILCSGQEFNTAIKSLSNISSIQFANQAPTASTQGDILVVSEATSPVKANMVQLTTGEVIVYPEEAGSPLVANESCYRMFYSISATSISFDNFDTSNVTNMSYMFCSCNLSTSLDLSSFDTSNVTVMDNMFYNCNTTELNLSNLNTSNVTNMTYMFCDCSSPIIIGLEDLDTSKVTDMSDMLRDIALIELDLSKWDTSNVTDMFNMFRESKNLVSLNLSNWDISKVTTVENMFYYCYNLVTVNLSNWLVYNLDDMSSMFYECSSLTKIIGLENLNTSNITYMSYMFYNCNKLSSSIVIMKRPSSYSQMFSACSTKSGSEFIVKYIDEITKNAAQNMVNTKSSNSNVILWVPPVTLLDGDSFSAALQSLNAGMETPTITFSKEYTNVTWTDTVLVSTSDSLTKAYAYYDIDTGFNIYPEISNAIICANSNSAYMFANSLFTDYNFDNFDTSNVEDMSYMFLNNSSILSLNLSKWNTSKVTSMNRMFSGCSRLGSIYVKDLWDVSNVIDDENMFYRCKSIIGKSGTSYNSSKVGKEMANIETGYLTDEKLLLVETAIESTYKITVINNKNYINIKTQPGVTSYNAQIHVELYDTLEIGKSYKISIETLNGASFYTNMSGNSAGAGDGTWNTNGNISELIFTATSATSELVLFSSGFYMSLPNTPAVNVVNIRFYEIF